VTTQSNSEKVDLSPATATEKQDSNSHKTAVDTNPPQTTPDNKIKVTPIIVDASQYDTQVEVRSYVTGIVENGGTCKFTFTKGTTTFQKQSSAVADATTTKCPNLTLASTEFSAKGTWSVVVSYDSSKATGASNVVNFEVK
jgi:GH25 family lysozyme M1 (1,4-beta-N-acetylmuramidase)